LDTSDILGILQFTSRLEDLVKTDISNTLTLQRHLMLDH